MKNSGRSHSTIRSTRRPFKCCTLCGKEWKTRLAFLSDRGLVLDGYQWNIKKVHRGEPVHGLLIFTHRVKGCGTSLALPAAKFGTRRREEESS